MAATGAQQSGNNTPNKTARLRIDKATVLGLGLAVCGIVGGLLLERGAVSDITQGTAALIVFGGTLGAILIGTPLSQVWAAARAFRMVIFEPEDGHPELIQNLIYFANKARRHGIVSLESDAEKIDDPFLRKAIELATDGLDSTEIRNMLEVDIDREERRMSSWARVYETAGGYAPTIGILGAILGLIQVMKSLADIEQVGQGIAIAFVATIYGVGSANLLFLPAASKIRNHARRRVEIMDLMIKGVSGIVDGTNPRLLRRNLAGLTDAEPPVAMNAGPLAAPVESDPEKQVSL